ncbi:MAG: SIS domain-containing protein [Rubrimonas sp.]|uniref:KpsF/GutQ family sugar-phosphate isomerase n=1 Tax=Rubrimonas sp. TaxID=2036015 RepID=UPI002FDE7139
MNMDADALLATGRRVLRIEAEALAGFADSLGSEFARAVETILGAQGRVIVSGMGKSGHVGRKIAATFASTGTPAQFVHPAEASHGDLGMLTRQDVALVLSNSGETPELRDIVAHTRRFSIPLIGVASRPGSALLTAADVALLLPDAPEACSVGLAPTTSTTLTMALGDALAVALMERRDFTMEHFRTFHPGGKLGAMLVKVRDLMHTGAALPLVARDASMPDVLLEMSAKGFGVAGVLDAEGRLAGIVTDGDLRRHMQGLLERSAGEVATPSPRAIGPDALASEAVARMNEGKPVTVLFVLPEGEGPRAPLGLLHIHDCLRAGVA